jgi:hypothetical protein
LALLFGGLSWGCGGNSEITSSVASGQKVKTAQSNGPPTVTQAADSSSFQNANVVTVPPAIGPAVAEPAPEGPLEIVSSDAQPATVVHGTSVVYTITTRGAAVSATMEVKGLEMQDVPLTEKTVDGDLTIWTATVPAPATQGNYRFYPTAIDVSGAKVTPPGVSAWSGYLTVT